MIGYIVKVLPPALADRSDVECKRKQNKGHVADGLRKHS